MFKRVNHLSGFSRFFSTTMEKSRVILDECRVVTANRTSVEEKINKIISDGPENLQFIVDFDYTMSRAHKNGVPVDCSWGVFENFDKLPSTYHSKVKTIRDKYYPVEIDLSIKIEDKIPLMVEWYQEANNLLAESQVKKDWFPEMVAASNCELRDDTDLMLKLLADNNIPVLVLSAGLGDLIKEIMIYNEVFHNNTILVSNFLEFDSSGTVVGLENKDNMIHMFNKSERSLSGAKADHVKQRKNVIILGDSLGDLKMADGVENPNVLLTLGFLNKNKDENLVKYKEAFDVVLVDDQTMDFPNFILSDMLKK